MATYLSSIGHQVHAITGFPYYPQWKIQAEYRHSWFSSELINGVNISRCPLYIPQKPTGLKRIIQDFTFLITSGIVLSGFILKRKKFDTIFTVSPSFLNGLTALWYKMFFPRTKIVYHLQDLQIDAAKDLGIIKNKFVLNQLDDIEDFILKRVDIVSTITKGMQQKILTKKATPKKTIVFPNWTTIHPQNISQINLTILKELNIPQDKKIIFYAGAIGEKQGLDILLDLAELTFNNLPDVYFLIAGAGPYTEKLKAITKKRMINNIQFIEIQPTEIYITLLQYATINLVIQRRAASDLVMPSKLSSILGAGGLALVTAEAASSLHQLIAENEIGIAVDPENLRLIYNAIERVVISTNSEMNSFGQVQDVNIIDVKRLRENAFQYAQNHLSKEALIADFMKQVQELN